MSILRARSLITSQEFANTALCAASFYIQNIKLLTDAA